MGMTGAEMGLWASIPDRDEVLATIAREGSVSGFETRLVRGDGVELLCRVSARKVQAGELWFEKALTDSFLSAKRIALTRREGQLVTLLAQGLKNKEIASMLLISEGTVKVYLSRLFQKLGVKDRFELALYGLKNLTGGQGALDRQPLEKTAGELPQLQGLRALVMERPAPRVQPQVAPFVVSRFQAVRQNVR